MKLYAINYSYKLKGFQTIHYDTWYVGLKDYKAVTEYLNDASKQFNDNGMEMVEASFREIESLHNGYKVVVVKETD